MLQESALAGTLAGTGADVDFSGTWRNDIKSKMVITQTGNTITGEYTSKKSDDGNEANGSLSGFVDGDLISFVVHWDKFQAITSWVGQIVPKTSGRQIKTLWQMTRQVKEGEEWASINAGSDLFTKAVPDA